MALHLRLGSPVTNDDFFGREKEIRKAWREIMQGNNLLFAAPRRVGKTSFAHRLEQEAGNLPEWKAIYLDLEGINSIPQFLKSFSDELEQLYPKALHEKIHEGIRKLCSQISFSVPVAGGNAELSLNIPQTEAFDALKKILSEVEDDVLIVFDELTVFLGCLEREAGENAVKSFLNGFRAMHHVTAKCHWIICSSIGVRNYTNLHNLSDTINDMHDFPLGAFSQEEAIGLVDALCLSGNISMTSAVKTYLLEKIGWNIPYFIQLIFSGLDEGEITVQHIDAAYNGLIERNYFDTWMERIRKEYGENQNAAKLLLNALCVSIHGVARSGLLTALRAKWIDFDEERFCFLIKILKTDGYLAEEQQILKFRSPLLRDYWKKTFVI